MLLRFHILTATILKITASWDREPCIIGEVDRHFRGASCLHHQVNVVAIVIIIIIIIRAMKSRL
jgi:hypothetical protein